ncbi:copper-binding protein [Hyphomicrobium sp. CS1BSMeth3]|jgi:Cu(I)/Ag(I) efflux system protein CusF|uniref:copper-binding protein n=1 Tax=Hyphomicrobium sp. CS1BSMeth3 TaxID=1892844 RepID=UPI000930DDD3|nr:copper-binding protein [Hyphomicrobium sp. CS1BSMeth3]MBN9263054.1 copper-binding protein [Hyphomicrobium sp.]
MRKSMITLIAAVWVTGLATVAVAQMVDGEITKVDEAAGKMTIRHGPLKKFDMDAMTMVFRASDPAMLKQVKPGDKVRFEPDKVNGQFTVMKIEKKK